MRKPNFEERQFTVYIVRCTDGSYYTGITNDVDRRISEHNDGINPKSYTFKRRPVELVYARSSRYVLNAIEWEKQAKGWSRKKKEALIRDNPEMLTFLAKCNNATRHSLFIVIRRCIEYHRKKMHGSLCLLRLRSE